MTTEFDDAAATEPAAEQPVRKRRAVSRSAGAPEPVETPTAAPAALPSVAGGGATAVTVGSTAPPKRRAARRTASAAATPAPAPDPTAVTLPTVAAHTPADSAEPASSPTAVLETETEEAKTEATEAAEAEATTSTPKRTRPPRRRSRSRRNNADRQKPADDAHTAPEVTDPGDSGTTASVAAEETAAAVSAAAEPAEQPAVDAPPATPAIPAAVASPFLLFQAPEPIVEPPTPPSPTPVADDEEPDAVTTSADSSDDEETDEDDSASRRRRRRRGGRGRRRRSDEETPNTVDSESGDSAEASTDSDDSSDRTTNESTSEEVNEDGGSSRRRRRRRRSSSTSSDDDQVTSVKGSTRLEAKRQRRRDGRETGRRRQVVSEAEFLARRESVERSMVVREGDGRTQVAVLEDGVLVEHYVARKSQKSMIGNVYVGRVQNVLPSMEAAFVDIGKGRNAVLYAGEVNWDAAGLDGQPRRIEVALKSGDPVVVQVTKDPVGHKGPRLTSQVSLPGRYLVFVPGRVMTGISRKLPETERTRLKKILKTIVPEDAGVIVRTAAEGASEEELTRDIARLQKQWQRIQKKIKTANPPCLLYQEPSLAVKIIRDVFNEDFKELTVAGEEAWTTVSSYVEELAPDLAERVHPWDPAKGDVFEELRLDEQLSKAMERTVYLPSGGSLVIDRTEAMTVVDVNTGRFTGSGGNLEATVTKNNLEAAEEIIRQLRLRDIGGIIVVDFIDMVLESNRDLVLRRLMECLSRDRTKHQVAEVTSLGLVQMTRKRIGQGLHEVFSEPCTHCAGQGWVVHQVKGFSASSVTLSADEEKEQFELRRAEQAAAVARVAAASMHHPDETTAEAGTGPDKAKAGSTQNATEVADADSGAVPEAAAETAQEVAAETSADAPKAAEEQPSGRSSRRSRGSRRSGGRRRSSGRRVDAVAPDQVDPAPEPLLSGTEAPADSAVAAPVAAEPVPEPATEPSVAAEVSAVAEPVTPQLPFAEPATADSGEIEKTDDSTAS